MPINSVFQPTSCADHILNGATSTVKHAAAGAVTAAIFGTFNPLIGAAFGATQAISGAVLNAIVDKSSPRSPEFSTCVKIALAIPIFIASTIAAVFVTASFGFPITLLTGIAFSVGMIIGRLVLLIFTSGLKSCSQCIAGTTLALARA